MTRSQLLKRIEALEGRLELQQKINQGQQEFNNTQLKANILFMKGNQVNRETIELMAERLDLLN